MQRNNAPAFGTGPLFLFLAQIQFYTRHFGADAVLDQADFVFQPVPLINLLDEGAWKGIALEAESNSPIGGAGFDFASVAISRLGRLLSVAAWTGFLLTDVGVAGGASDSARSQHVCGNSGCFHFQTKLAA